VTKSRKDWATVLGCVERNRNAYKVLVREVEGKRLFGFYETIILK
jgi:hypothetical protein